MTRAVENNNPLGKGLLCKPNETFDPVMGLTKACRNDMLESWKQRAGKFKVQTYALYLAYRDPRTPWYASAWAAIVVAYAFSPIDLIPDFIPILGYLDDLILIPVGVALALKMIPPEVMGEAQEKARQAEGAGRSVGWAAAAVIIILWLLLAAGAILLILRFVARFRL